MPGRNSHCSCCGAAFAESPWPRKCSACGNTTWLNPTPVAVLLVPVDKGLLVIKRRQAVAGRGRLALPGGFIELGESWQQAAARETYEEAGVPVSVDEVTLYDARSAPDGTLLVFGLARPRRAVDLPTFVSSDEVGERTVMLAPAELAFPLHADVARRWFAERAATRPVSG
jgi:ADP-ribose pyrophosphatase YjhB (NUDIX family)